MNNFSTDISKEIMEFKARDLIKEFSIFVIEDGTGFHVVNKPFKKVYGPFDTLEEAHELLAYFWDEIIENSIIWKQ